MNCKYAVGPGWLLDLTKRRLQFTRVSSWIHTMLFLFIVIYSSVELQAYLDAECWLWCCSLVVVRSAGIMMDCWFVVCVRSFVHFHDRSLIVCTRQPTQGNVQSQNLKYHSNDTPLYSHTSWQADWT